MAAQGYLLFRSMACSLALIIRWILTTAMILLKSISITELVERLAITSRVFVFSKFLRRSISFSPILPCTFSRSSNSLSNGSALIAETFSFSIRLVPRPSHSTMMSPPGLTFWTVPTRPLMSVKFSPCTGLTTSTRKPSTRAASDEVSKTATVKRKTCFVAWKKLTSPSLVSGTRRQTDANFIPTEAKSSRSHDILFCGPGVSCSVPVTTSLMKRSASLYGMARVWSGSYFFHVVTHLSMTSISMLGLPSSYPSRMTATTRFMTM
mmetsp:Transcript_34373/g.103770  ORF Transcript_34373/g.103770 Transcript_34373/m.103770 type:complete len:265 (+) Transcript_34373:56-850(+)